MPRLGELTYYQAIGEAGRRHAIARPFGDDQCGLNLMQVGAIFQLLPAPPARVLDCGCGPGWLSYLLHRRGYEVVGTDVSPQAIHLARSNPVYRSATTPSFLVADSERLPFEAEFDAVVFFDSLHHSDHEQDAVSAAYRALKPGGVCITSEPGPGHALGSKEFMELYDVTDKDMPPSAILKLGKAAGFRRRLVYPRPDEIGKYYYPKPFPGERRLVRWFKRWPFNLLAGLLLATFLKRRYGIVVMYK
jgi:SAM-dependent methyltransferase